MGKLKIKTTVLARTLETLFYQNPEHGTENILGLQYL